MKMLKLTQQEAEKLCAEKKGKPLYEEEVAHLTSDLVVGLELIADNCVSKWRDLCDPQNPYSLSSKFGSKGVKTAVHGSDSSSSAAK